jgi:hypothetical protein
MNELSSTEDMDNQQNVHRTEILLSVACWTAGWAAIVGPESARLLACCLLYIFDCWLVYGFGFNFQRIAITAS